ncbi:hypothetical protein Q75_06885 [Bacillus coahuilensis p1.1.43]|uniref:Calcineurin-like phosphoesterase domain-containing protein n=1 Tax=Bacillus coahuilensis p1.1.43 TaxID=1150625 RepID=A0A147K8Y2_9BACI|nr:metallophosphoesterase family protein [Bacillus coahuilensis]KUP06806.1 hypothetical protein Q75_06885 [Bacillus coahuilensis p1.1.43]
MNYTKIAFITDIHGNPYALESVLNKIDQLNVDQIFCGGDQVAIGPFSNEVMEILTSREDVQCVHGNHDLCVLAIFHNQPYPRSHAHAYSHHEWIARNLDPKWIPFMNSWKREIQIKVGGKPTLVTHYGYVKELLHAPIDREPYKNIVEPSKENMVELYKEKNRRHPIIWSSSSSTLFSSEWYLLYKSWSFRMSQQR